MNYGNDMNMEIFVLHVIPARKPVAAPKLSNKTLSIKTKLLQPTVLSIRREQGVKADNYFFKYRILIFTIFGVLFGSRKKFKY